VFGKLEHFLTGAKTQYYTWYTSCCIYHSLSNRYQGKYWLV